MISRKELTVAEIRTRLQGRQEDGEVVEEVMARLEAASLLDDERFAAEFARDKRVLAGWGSNRIAAALSRRGIAPELIDAALVDEEGSDVERAVKLLESRSFDLEDSLDRRRGLGLLSRKGFSAEDSYEAVRRVARQSGVDLVDGN